ncbi:MAG: hypothetical protein ACR2KE_03920 [Candidatus Nanopelagicales bacterium]
MAIPPLVGVDVPAAGRSMVAAGLILGVVVSGMFVLFIAGEILSDPGGWTGLAWVAAWLLPPLALSVLAVVRPRIAHPLLVVIVWILVAASVASIFRARIVWEFEDTHGPVNLLVQIAVLIPLVALGRAMPREAGRLMAIALIGPLVFQAISLVVVGQWSVVLVLVVVAVPFGIVALLLILGGRQASVDVGG